MDVVAAASFLISGLSFLLLSLYIFRRFATATHQAVTPAMATACLGTALWAYLHIAPLPFDKTGLQTLLESIRNGLWYHFLTIATLGPHFRWRSQYSLIHLPWLLTLIVTVANFTAPSGQFGLWLHDTTYWGVMISSIAGLILTEQAYRNTDKTVIPGMRFIYFAIAGLFAYDLYAYVWSFMFHDADPTLWRARGFISLLTAALIFFGINRLGRQQRLLQISRHVVFYSTSLVMTGLFLLILAIGGYYVRELGGTWGGLIQTVFVFSAFALLLLLASSEKIRAYTRVMISKHLFSHKYDYREEWLRLIQTLTDNHSGANISELSIRALAQIFKTNGGALWLLHDQRHYLNTASINFGAETSCEIPVNSGLIRELQEKRLIIVTHDLSIKPEQYNHLALPDCLREPNTWAIVPLLTQERLIGFIALTPPAVDRKLTWEDFDLLKTAGLQIASFLSSEQSAQALMEAKQFDAYSKLTAFIMHDLKNLIAQQSLVVKNAAKHKDNPAFVEDAIHTIDNSVKRMNRLLDQLKQGHEIQKPETIELKELLVDTVRKCHNREPRPSLQIQEEGLQVNSSPDQLSMIIGHVIRNAQDATAATGFIDVTLSCDEHYAIITVEDNGVGMSPEFIRDRLFKPFDTTKASKGMGIGAYQTREFIRQAGGDVDIQSQEGQGTTFTIHLPKLKKGEQEADT